MDDYVEYEYLNCLWEVDEHNAKKDGYVDWIWHWVADEDKWKLFSFSESLKTVIIIILF